MAKVALSYGHGANTYEDKRSKFVQVGGKIYEEHTHNAEVGVRLKKILVAHGVQVLEVQPAYGTDVSLTTRTNKANSWGADIYWSIHSNAGASSARGWCGFYWKGSSTGLKLAQLYAKHVKATGLPAYSTDYMYPSERGTWSDFHELRETAMPALLTENGFMTNSEDFKYIFQNKNGYYDFLAVAHAKAILEYFGIAYKGSSSTPETSVADYKPTQEDYDKGRIGRVQITVDKLNFRNEPSLESSVIKELTEGQVYYVYAVDGMWYNLGGGWASAGSDGSLLKYYPFPDQYHTVVAGDTLWSISQKYETSVTALKTLNGLTSDVLSIGQRLRVK
jgi:hypothetical protein